MFNKPSHLYRVLFLGAICVTGCDVWHRASAWMQSDNLEAVEDSEPSATRALASASDAKSWYKVAVRDFVVGSAVAMNDNRVEMAIREKIGSFPIEFSSIQMQKSDGKNSITEMTVRFLSAQSQFGAAQTVWKTDDKTIQLDSRKSLSLAFLLGGSTDFAMPLSQDWGSSTSHLFFRPLAATTDARIFSPFTGTLFSQKELSATWGADGFLESAIVPTSRAISFDLKRVSKEEYDTLEESFKKDEKQFNDFSWFSSQETLSSDIANLAKNAEVGLGFARVAEIEAKRNFKNLPYLIHRKLLNFETLCRKTIEVLAANSQGIAAGKPPVFTAVTRVIENEDRRELPIAIGTSSEWEILRDPAALWQGPRLLSSFLRRGLYELSETFAIERTRKTDVRLRLNLAKFSGGAVLRVHLRAKDIALKTSLEVAMGGMKPSSLTAWLPRAEKPLALASARDNVPLALPKKTFEYLNGQAFANGAFHSMDEICIAYQGRVGMDLGDAEHLIFRGDIARGIWDSNTRSRVAFAFLMRAAAAPACSEVLLRVPKNLGASIAGAFESFKRDVLQSEMEFQIKNQQWRNVRLAPGLYELVVTSLVNNAVLSKKDVLIPAGKSSTLALSLN